MASTESTETTLPVCEIPLESDGSINFNMLEFYSQDCIIPPSLKSVNIPISFEQPKLFVRDRDMTTEVDTTTLQAIVGIPRPVDPLLHPPTKDVLPMTTATIAGAAAVGSTMAMNYITKILKGNPSHNKSKRDRGNNQKNREGKEEKQEDHKNCAVERVTMSSKLDDLEHTVDGVVMDVNKVKDDIGEIKKMLKEMKKNSQRPEFDSKEYEERLEKIEKSIKKETARK